MLPWKCVGPLFAGVVLLPYGMVSGDEEKAKDRPAVSQAAEAQKAPSAQQIAKLVEQLDADRFAERQAASEKLAAAGKAAIPALAKAAVGESLEATVRAIDILKKFLQSSDEPTKIAAREALETIAKSDRPAAARRAQDIVKPKPTPAEEQPAPAPAGGPNIIIGGGAIFQIQANAGGGGKKMSVKNVNGVKDIDVEEGDKKIKIHDDPQQGIKIEVTTKKDGKDKTDKYEAKDAEELKKKQPEGYKIYKEYGENQGGAANIQIQVAGGIAPAVPVPVPAIGAVPAARNVQRNQVESTTALLKILVKRLETLIKDEQLPKAPAQSKDELQKQLVELKTQIAELEKRLQEEPKKSSDAANKPAEKKEEKATPARPSGLN